MNLILIRFKIVDIEPVDMNLLDSFRRSVLNYCQNPSRMNQAEFEKLIMTTFDQSASYPTDEHFPSN